MHERRGLQYADSHEYLNGVAQLEAPAVRDQSGDCREHASDFTSSRGRAAATVIVPTPPILPANVNNEGATAMLMGFNLDQWIALSHGTSAKFPVSGYDLLETTTDTLAPFANHGGKVVIWQPQTGGPFSPMAMVDWYEKLNLNNGGTASDYTKRNSTRACS